MFSEREPPASHMQVDNFPNLSLQLSGQKRSRSPASPSLYERPVKRTSLPPGAVQRTPPPLLENTAQTRRRQEASGAKIHHQKPQPFLATHEYKVSDDWVTKTGGLKLDSPLFGGNGGYLSLPEAEKWGRAEPPGAGYEDERMNTDMDDLTVTYEYSRPLDYSAEGRHTSHLHTHNVALSSLHSATPQAFQPSSAHPDRHIHASSVMASHHASRTLPLLQSNTPASTSLSSPDNSKVSPHPARKPRVTIGPRPDCDKCRNKAKDHWMHID